MPRGVKGSGPKGKKSAAAAPEQKSVGIEELSFTNLMLKIVGVTPLIVHNWDQKAMLQILGKQMGLALPDKGKRDPQAEFMASRYIIPEEQGGGDGMPAAGLKQCAVDACRHVEGIPMTYAVGSFQVRGIEVEAPPFKFKDEQGKEYEVGRPSKELIPIYGDEAEKRLDMVRLDNGSADLRFRAMYRNWFCYVPLQIANGSMTVQQVVNLFNRAGFHCGLCEWRPFSKKSKNGSYGQFKVASTREELALFDKVKPPVIFNF